MADVVIVDDDPTLRRIMCEILSDVGHSVREAPDGCTMLMLLRLSLTPLVVVLDRRLPDMDGLEALAQLRDTTVETAPTHAFILCTAWDRTLTAAEQALLTQLQVTVLPKPFNIEELWSHLAGAAQRLAAVPCSVQE